VGQQELFTLAVAIAGVMIVGRAVARRLEIPDAIVLVVLGVLVGLIPHGYLPVRRARPATCPCGVPARLPARAACPPGYLPVRRTRPAMPTCSRPACPSAHASHIPLRRARPSYHVFPGPAAHLLTPVTVLDQKFQHAVFSVEDPASVEDPGNPGCPKSPPKPDPPR
jgi:hypothetical protein